MAEDLVWVDPDCSAGHPFKNADKHEWRPPDENHTYRSCFFCGSMHPEDLLKELENEDSACLALTEYDALLKAAGPKLEGFRESLPPITFEWADFKYGHPHKLYVKRNRGEKGHWGKFYTKHLMELTGHTFDVVATKLAVKTYVLFVRKEDGEIKWKGLPRPKAKTN